MSLKREGLKNFTLMTVSVLAMLMVCELVARIFYGIYPSEMNHFSLSKSHYYKSDDELGWIPRENIRGMHNKQGSFSTTFRTNSRGLRDKEYKLNNADGVKRVVVLGDSFTWGYGVNDDEIYTERLESILSDTEVINLGVTGYNSKKEAIYFLREGVKYQPDILILGFCLNDIWENSIEEKGGANIHADLKKELKPAQSNPQAKYSVVSNFVKKTLLEKSAFFGFIRDRIYTNKSLVKGLVYIGLKKPLTGYKNLDINLRPALRLYPNDLMDRWAKTKKQLRHLKRLTRKLGIRFIVAVVPSVQSVQQKTFKHTIAFSVFNEKDFDLDAPYDLLREFAAQENIEIVIPIKEFRSRHNEGNLLFLNRDMHFNEAGHELFAKSIADYLEKRAPPLVGEAATTMR